MGILNHVAVMGEGVAPGRWVYVLHGIFGAGRNWGSVARRLVRAHPDVGVLLVDLRQHGGSQGFPPPHTVRAAAADVAALARSEGHAPWGLLGHSFGGKVALAFARDHARGLKRVWVVDSTPATRSRPTGSAWRMLELLESLPPRFDSRDALVATLEAHGLARGVAQWMATNLERTEHGYVWRFDLVAMRALLEDFFHEDLWDVVARPPAGCTLHFIKAADSAVLDADTLARLRRLGEANGRVRVHVLEGGHWLNADNPDGVLDLLGRTLG